MPEDTEILTFVCTGCDHNEDFEEGEFLSGWTAGFRRTNGWGNQYIVFIPDPTTEDASEDASPELFCEDCTEENLAQCTHCSEWGHIEANDMRRVGYDWVCFGCFEDRYTMCDDCEEVFNRDYMVPVEEGQRSVCECCRDSYNICCTCDEYWFTESGHWDDDDGDEEWWCAHCWEHSEESPRNSVIQHYGHRPVLKFRWSMGKHGHGFWVQSHTRKLRTAHYYGMELEVEPAPGKGATSETVKQEAEYIDSNYGDFLYLKRDSSVPSGFEIVSHPATLEWWHEQGTKMFGDILMRLRNNGFQSHNGGHCGLHIHTNKNALSRLQAMRMTEFIFFENNRTKMKMLSRRSTSSLRNYSSLEIPTHFNYDSEDYEEWTSKQYAKYVGKNMLSRTRNALYFGHETAELRLFRGTLRDDRVWASLQFFDLLIQYCTNEHAGNPSWREFRNFAHQAPRQYAQIQSYLLEKQI